MVSVGLVVFESRLENTDLQIFKSNCLMVATSSVTDPFFKKIYSKVIKLSIEKNEAIYFVKSSMFRIFVSRNF